MDKSFIMADVSSLKC